MEGSGEPCEAGEKPWKALENLVMLERSPESSGEPCEAGEEPWRALENLVMPEKSPGRLWRAL